MKWDGFKVLWVTVENCRVLLPQWKEDKANGQCLCKALSEPNLSDVLNLEP